MIGSARIKTAISICAIILNASCLSREYLSYKIEVRSFFNSLNTADEIVVIDSIEKLSDNKTVVLLKLKDKKQISDLISRIEFEFDERIYASASIGSPEIQIYKNHQMIGNMLVKRNTLYWSGFKGERKLTPKSIKKLIAFYSENGVKDF